MAIGTTVQQQQKKKNTTTSNAQRNVYNPGQTKAMQDGGEANAARRNALANYTGAYGSDAMQAYQAQQAGGGSIAGQLSNLQQRILGQHDYNEVIQGYRNKATEAEQDYYARMKELSDQFANQKGNYEQAQQKQLQSYEQQIMDMQHRLSSLQRQEAAMAGKQTAAGPDERDERIQALQNQIAQMEAAAAADTRDSRISELQKQISQMQKAAAADTRDSQISELQDRISQMQAEAEAAKKKPYNWLDTVSENTKNQMAAYQQGYTPGAQAAAAQASLEAIQGQRPQNYTSKYGVQLDGLLQQIQNPEDYAGRYAAQLDSMMGRITNPEKFNYEFNGDNLFKYYADQYTQRGKQASMDAMGQAAALTGGYGNSYGQMLGQQQYQQNLQGLYDRGLELRDRAYQEYRDRRGDDINAYNLMAQADATDYGRYRDRMNDRLNAYNLTAQAEASDYGRYRDTVGDWENERAYAANRADTERNFDYGRYQDNLNYWTGLAQIENAAYNSEADRQEAIRQYEQNFGENQRQYDTSMGEGQRQFDLNYGENQRQYDTSMGENQRQFNENLGENRRQYDTSMGENQRQFNLNFGENQRQFNENLGENRRQFNENLAENKRQYDETSKLNYQKLAQDQAQHEANLSAAEKENNRKYAVDYVSAILANGEIPSDELLVAAGLSYEDAQKLLAQVATGTGGQNPGSGDTSGGGEDMAFDEANLAILRDDIKNNPGKKLSEINPNLPSNITLGDLNKIVGPSLEKNKKTGNNKFDGYVQKLLDAMQ